MAATARGHKRRAQAVGSLRCGTRALLYERSAWSAQEPHLQRGLQVGVAHYAAADQHKVPLDDIFLLHEAQRLALCLASGRGNDMDGGAAAARAALPPCPTQVGTQLVGARGRDHMNLHAPGGQKQGTGVGHNRRPEGRGLQSGMATM